MSTYKVIQDIEAEDKLIGPLTLRQFIYAAIAAFCLYLSFIAITKHVAFLVLIFLPIIVVCGFFAFPFGRDQPTEVWALAKIRFMLKPHKRVWNQSGIKELVTITAPKRSPKIYTDGLSRAEVQSRLKALASTIDTRGWATKNVNINLYQSPVVVPANASDSDRLVNATSLPQTVPDLDIQAADDVLDEKNNPTAHNLEQLITTSSQQHRQQVIKEVNQVATNDQPTAGPASDYWFLNQPAPSPSAKGYATFDTQRVVTPGSTQDDSQLSTTTDSETEEERALSAELRSHHDTSVDTYRDHMKVIEPLSTKKRSTKAPVKTPKLPTPPQMTQAPDPAILALASNNDLNVATIARQANKTNKPEPPEDEVVINLH